MNSKMQVLSDEDILKIHATSLEIREKLGIHIQDKEALKTVNACTKITNEEQK